MFVYHLNHDLLSGGYIGVDVILRGLRGPHRHVGDARDQPPRAGSLANFYIRRVRRIPLAFTLVVVVTGVLAIALLPSPRLADTAAQLAASAAYVENSFLANQAVDYLAAGGALAWLTTVAVESPIRRDKRSRGGAGQYTHPQRLGEVRFAPEIHVGLEAISYRHAPDDAPTARGKDGTRTSLRNWYTRSDPTWCH